MNQKKGGILLKVCGFSFLVMLFFSQNILAETHNIFIQGDSISIDSGGTIDRFLSSMTNDPGKIRLKAAFHVDSGFNQFEKLRIEIKKGTQSIFMSNCYSIHAPANFTPKCDLTIPISEEIADIRDNYVLKIHNNSGKRIKGFNINKKDFDPLVPDFKSTFTTECPSEVSLRLDGAPLTLEKGEARTREIIGISNKKGRIVIQAKWHTVTLIPNFFVQLKVELLKPNGSVARSGNFYSFHAPLSLSPRLYNLAISYPLTQSDSEMTGRWKIRVTNISNDKIDGFDIKKGTDGNPAVKSFISTYKQDCQ